MHVQTASRYGICAVTKCVMDPPAHPTHTSVPPGPPTKIHGCTQEVPQHTQGSAYLKEGAMKEMYGDLIS
jgi:hypothetical protein